MSAKCKECDSTSSNISQHSQSGLKDLKFIHHNKSISPVWIHIDFWSITSILNNFFCDMGWIAFLYILCWIVENVFSYKLRLPIGYRPRSCPAYWNYFRLYNLIFIMQLKSFWSLKTSLVEPWWPFPLVQAISFFLGLNLYVAESWNSINIWKSNATGGKWCRWAEKKVTEVQGVCMEMHLLSFCWDLGTCSDIWWALVHKDEMFLDRPWRPGLARPNI